MMFLSHSVELQCRFHVKTQIFVSSIEIFNLICKLQLTLFLLLLIFHGVPSWIFINVRGRLTTSTEWYSVSSFLRLIIIQRGCWKVRESIIIKLRIRGCPCIIIILFIKIISSIWLILWIHTGKIRVHYPYNIFISISSFLTYIINSVLFVVPLITLNCVGFLKNLQRLILPLIEFFQDSI